MLKLLYKLLGLCEHDFKLIKIYKVNHKPIEYNHCTEYYSCIKCKKNKVKEYENN